MNTQTRTHYLLTFGKLGLHEHAARKLLRYAATLDRLNVALCNGDWPCDNGERKLKECPQCMTGYVASSFRCGKCPDCRTQELARELCATFGLAVEFNGDPRGLPFRISRSAALAAPEVAKARAHREGRFCDDPRCDCTNPRDNAALAAQEEQVQ